jgi:hypothetical protein
MRRQYHSHSNTAATERQFSNLGSKAGSAPRPNLRASLIAPSNVSSKAGQVDRRLDVLKIGDGRAKTRKAKFKIRWKTPRGDVIGVSEPMFATKTEARNAARDMREWWGADANDLKFDVIGLKGEAWTRVK